MSRSSSRLRFSRTPQPLRFFILLLALVALVAPVNFVLITPGPATALFPKVLTIGDDVPSYPVNGQLSLLTIYVTNPETYVFGAEVAGCWAWGECVAVPRSVMYEDGATNKEESKASTAEMTESQNVSLAAAKSVIARKFPALDVSGVKDSAIKVSLKNTGGPSGGLIFTLGIVDLLTPQDILQGRKIAGTGTITADGTLGPIGGVTEKIIGAKRAGASSLFISTQNCNDLPAKVEGISVIAVEKIDQVIDHLFAGKNGSKGGVGVLNSAGIHGCASV